MATPTSTLWERDPHTAAKHQLLSGYLAAWFPIISKKYPSLTYAEGFAGPNEYLGGEPGSPSIALAQGTRAGVLTHDKPIRFVFVEKDSKRFVHLESKIEQAFPASTRHPSVEIRCVNGECEQHLLPALRDIGAWSAPIFANLDGFGADVPYDVVRRVGSNKSSEVLVTMAPSHFLRFAEVQEAKAGDRFFGDQSWREVASCPSPDEKRRFLIDHYRKALALAGFPRALHFEMRDEGGHELYLFFGTSNDLGIEKMKDLMWKIDSNLGQRFRDPRDPGQLAFGLDKPNLVPLQRELLDVVATRKRLTVEDLRAHTLLETIYRKPHAMEVLRNLRNDGSIIAEPTRIASSTVVTLPSEDGAS